METIRVKRFLLVGQSVIYLIAFSSIYYQIPALYGEKGIAPVAAKIEKNAADDSLNSPSPFIHFLTHKLDIKPSIALQITALLGMVISLLTIAIRPIRSFFAYLVLVLLYWSIVKVGDTFLYFQWDSLVLESGWLMAVVAATGNSPADVISTYLVRFLAARLMFSSGIVKLQSNCPTWWGLTALDIHFESQCIPTPLAWFAHHQPEWTRRLGVALTFFIEIYLPPMFLLPIPTLRKLAAIPNILLMFLIMATGNYNFFNIHYALLCVACFEGGYSSSQISGRPFIRRFLEVIASLAIFGGALVHWAAAFGIQFDPKTTTVVSKITFSKAEFAKATKLATSVFVHIAIVGFVLAFFEFVKIVWFKPASTPTSDQSKHGKKGGKGGKGDKKVAAPEKTKSVSAGEGIFGRTGRHALLVLFFGNFLFWTSFVPFTQIDQAASDRIPDVLRVMHQKTANFEMTHSYGLFRRMTGVEGRPEIVLEGSHQPQGPWTEIEFFSKPGALSTAPVFVLPHQPRLDWQMWFAALGAYQHNPWFMSMVNRLLNNDTMLIGQMKNWKFTNKKEPLQFIRAQLYHYRFSKKNDKNWWTRSLQHEYMPVMSKDMPATIAYLEQNGLVAKNKYKSGSIDKLVGKIHAQARQLPQTTFVWSTTAFGILLSFFL